MRIDDVVDIAAKVKVVLMAKSEEEKLHSMLGEKFWGADFAEKFGLFHSPMPLVAWLSMFLLLGR
jgi:hypothetical protein